MAIYRNVSLSFWEDIKIVDDFTPEDKYFYLYLLTNPHTNLLGCYQISFKQMTNETGYNKDTIEKLIDRMVSKHKVIEFDFETNEVFIKKWYKYNWTRSDKLLKNVEKLIQYIKSDIFKENMLKLVEKYRVSIGYLYPMDTSVSVSDLNNININNNNNKELIYKLFKEYIKLREENKYNISESIVNRLTKKLNEYGKTDEDKIEIISQAINGKWKDFYELKKEEKKEGVIYETI
jgi:hypothetical protein